MLGVAEAIGGTALRVADPPTAPARVPVPPLVAARAVLVARASALAGAIMTGAWAGLLAYVAPRSADIAAAADDTLGRGARRWSARWRWSAAALWLQHCCRTPDDPADGPGGRRTDTALPRRRA